MGERIDNLEAHMNARFYKVEQRLDKIEQRLDKVEKDINNIIVKNNLER